MRRLVWAAVLIGLAVPGVAAGGRVSRYLVEGRVHVTLFARGDGSGGQITWCDTVSGACGEAPYRVGPDGHEVCAADGVRGRFRVVRQVAVVFERPPWEARAPVPLLGVSTD